MPYINNRVMPKTTSATGSTLPIRTSGKTHPLCLWPPPLLSVCAASVSCLLHTAPALTPQSKRGQRLAALGVYLCGERTFYACPLPLPEPGVSSMGSRFMRTT